MDDSKLLFNAGPPFKRIVDGTPTEDVHVKGAVNCVRYSTEGHKIASVGSDKTVAIYDATTGANIAVLEHAHSASIYACAWSSNDHFLLTCSADGTVNLLSVEPLTVVHTWNVALLANGGNEFDKVPIGGMQVGCAFVHGDVPLCVSLNGNITILPKPPMLESDIDVLETLTGHNAPIAGLAVGTNGMLYTGDTNGLLCQWNLSTGKAVKRIQASDLTGKLHGDAAISCLACTSTGTLFTGGWDDKLRVISNGVVVATPIPLEAQPNAMACGAQLTAVLTVGGIFFVKDGDKVSLGFQRLNYSALSLCVSMDDMTLYVGGQDCKIYVYTISNDFVLDLKHVIENGHLKPVHALALSHDQTKLASADTRDVCVWNVDEKYSSVVGKSRWCFHTQRITCLSWSADDKLLASGGADDAIYIWSLAKKTKRLHYNFAHRGGITGIAFLEKFTLVSVGVDACVNHMSVISHYSNFFATSSEKSH